MRLEDIKKVGVIGAGIMGHGIGFTFALNGYKVTLHDVNERILGKAMNNIKMAGKIFVDGGLISPDMVEAALSRLATTTNLEKAVDPKWRAFRNKVKMVSHPEWDTTGISGGKIPLTVKLKNGREIKKVAPGTDVPIVVTDEQLMDKYLNCMERIYPKKQIDEATKMILALDELKDISRLMNILTFPEK